MAVQAELRGVKEDALKAMQLLEAQLQGLQGGSAEVEAFLQEKASMLRHAVEIGQTLEAERIAARHRLRQTLP